MGYRMSNCSLRDVIGEYVCELAEKDSRIVAVSADMNSTCRLKRFAELFPDRLFSVGIAEQNMLSFAAGLAHEGYVPFTFTMAPFMSMRACEQVRTDIAYANLHVIMHAPYAGVSGGISGATHWGLEDVAIMSAIANMKVLEPADAYSTKILLNQAVQAEGPVYLRTSVERVEDIYSNDCDIKLGCSSTVYDGDDLTVICSGVCVQYALSAAKSIRSSLGASVRIVDMHTIKPLDRKAVIDAAMSTGKIIVVQDHSVIGGLGQSVATVIAEAGLPVSFKIIGLPDMFFPMAHAPFLYGKFGLDTEGIENSIREMLKD